MVGGNPGDIRRKAERRDIRGEPRTKPPPPDEGQNTDNWNHNDQGGHLSLTRGKSAAQADGCHAGQRPSIPAMAIAQCLCPPTRRIRRPGTARSPMIAKDWQRLVRQNEQPPGMLVVLRIPVQCIACVVANVLSPCLNRSDAGSWIPPAVIVDIAKLNKNRAGRGCKVLGGMYFFLACGSGCVDAAPPPPPPGCRIRGGFNPKTVSPAPVFSEPFPFPV